MPITLRSRSGCTPMDDPTRIQEYRFTCHNHVTTTDFLPQFKRQERDLIEQIDLGIAAGRPQCVDKNQKGSGQFSQSLLRSISSKCMVVTFRIKWRSILSV